jgi:hypothetical protein
VTCDERNRPAFDSEASATVEPAELLERLSASTTAPHELASKLGGEPPSTRRVLAGYPGTPPLVLAWLATDPDEEVRQAAEQNPSTAPMSFAAYHTRCPRVPILWEELYRPQVPTRDDFFLFRQFLGFPPEDGEALDPATPPARLSALAKLGPLHARAVAENPEAPPALLADLSQHPDGEVRSMVARHPRTPPKVLALLAGDDKAGHMAQHNPATPREALRLLKRVGTNQVDPPVSEEELRHLAKGRPHARRLVARYPLTPGSLLEELVRDPDESVRATAAEHPHLSRRTLERLAAGAADAPASTSSSYALQGSIARNPAASETALRTVCATAGPERMAHALVNNPATPADVLRAVTEHTRAGYPDAWLRESVARHPRVSAELLARLAHDEAWLVRAMVAQAPATPEHAVTALLGDGISEVRAHAARHPRVSREHLELLWRAGAARDLAWFAKPDPGLRPEQLRQLVSALGEGTYVREVVARHPKAPEALLARWAKEPQLAWHVAWNPATPPELLELLAESPHAWVRDVLRLHPELRPALRARLHAEAELQGRIPSATPRDVAPVDVLAPQGWLQPRGPNVMGDWCAPPGRWLREGDGLYQVDLWTHFAEMEAPCSGVLTELLVKPGTELGPGQPVARIHPGRVPTLTRGDLPWDASLELRRALENVEACRHGAFVRHPAGDRPGYTCFVHAWIFPPREEGHVWTDGHEVRMDDPGAAG